MTSKEILSEIRAAFEREPRIRLHQNHIRTDLTDGTLLIEGEVNDIAAKKLAFELAGNFAVSNIVDRLHLIPATPVEDGTLRDSVMDAMIQEPTLKNCTIRAWVKGKEETIRDTQSDSGGAIHVFVENGVVTLEGQVLSLSHKRMAGVLAWWAQGCRDVGNHLAITPPEEDNDDEISDAVRLVLEKDHLLPADQIKVTTKDRVVTLEGLVFLDAERRRADADTWYVHRVRNVVNMIEVRQ